MTDISVRPVTGEDRAWMTQFLIEHWGSNLIVSRGKLHSADMLPGFVAIVQGERLGLLTYDVQGNECEIVTIDSIQPALGIGTALLLAVKDAALKAGCERLWLITTNDNVDALRFYQRRGFALVTIHRNAIEQSRKLKPQIPLIGKYGIPIRDEIELEMVVR